jgi:transcriptional regulator with XRE-family HTH domain
MIHANEFFANLAAENPAIGEAAREVDPPHVLAMNVLRLRKERGLTQQQLAELAGVAQPRIAEVERGDANPRLISLSKIAHALGVSLSALLEDRLNESLGGAAENADSVPASAPRSAARKRKTG